MIELASCSMDRELFMRMARDYVEALSKYDSEIVWDEMTWSKAAWYAQFIVEDRTVQGFVITEINTFAVFPPAMCIAEFYVVPEARNRHIGTRRADTDARAGLHAGGAEGLGGAVHGRAEEQGGGIINDSQTAV